MEEIIQYLESIGAGINKGNSELSEEIPFIMREFYEKIKNAELPYGRIFDIEEAIKKSERKPFDPDWFIFGQDNYYNFWLCSKKKNENGRYFTYWDHSSGLEIEEPIWEDLLSFLKEIEEETSGRW